MMVETQLHMGKRLLVLAKFAISLVMLCSCLFYLFGPSLDTFVPAAIVPPDATLEWTQPGGATCCVWRTDTYIVTHSTIEEVLDFYQEQRFRCVYVAASLYRFYYMDDPETPVWNCYWSPRVAIDYDVELLDHPEEDGVILLYSEVLVHPID